MLTFGNKYSYLFILSVGFGLGLYFSSLFSGCGRHGSSMPAIATVKPETMRKQVAAVQASYQVKIDSLGAAASNLQHSLLNTRTALDKAKQKNLVLQTQVYDLLDRTAPTIADTAARIMDCDTLQSRVKDLLIEDKEKDSLYEDLTGNLQTQLINKDLTIHIEQLQNQTLKASFTQSIQQQQWLQAENTGLQKHIRHQKVASTLKTIGLVIISALGGHILTRF